MRLPNWLTQTVVAIVSLLTAFFGVFNVLFSDHNGPRDAEVAVGFIFILYLITSIIIHVASRRPGWKWFWWLVVPAAVLGGVFLRHFDSVVDDDAGRNVSPLAQLVEGRAQDVLVYFRQAVDAPARWRFPPPRSAPPAA